SLGLVAAWRQQGFRIAPFKKGPDFIDAGWLTFAADRPCYNLDPFLMDQDQLRISFLSRSDHSDLSLIEGNRGLYDGLDLDGSSSTAELAKLLKAPVLIILDVTMATRTMAAIVKGCQVFDPEVIIAGVILNKVAGSRQERLITAAIETYCGLPIVGTVPKLKKNFFPERHMGLVPFQERDKAERAVSWAGEIVQKHLQLDRIWEIAQRSENVETSPDRASETKMAVGGASPRIGFIRDLAFWFYYPENLEQLERMGAVMVEVDAISSPNLPHLDALYIGGGFPETQAQGLADNQSFRRSLKEEIEKGLPVYAECGGGMFLGERLLVDNRSYPMVGVLPVEFVLQKKPQGHGYTVLEVVGANPYYAVGKTVRGHEFHYSRPVLTRQRDLRFAFKVARGRGIDGLRDGICIKNVLATYTHVHAAGNPDWAKGLFQAALEYKKADNFSKSRKECLTT
ncbi:MAG TPA: hydrogenobyrinic acid a,c-diamide synthase (glutamine-hydrolyzing), partial [Desulfobacteraceae bacterium]|nr:hydrogenobyrinic acid a,c-diamide synthase (glutamine-hydrolyzing) [Desulfobacteraceae bacterium]